MADSFVVGSLVVVRGRHGMLEVDNEDGTWSVGFDDGDDGDIPTADIKLAEVQMRKATSAERDAAALLAARHASTAQELAAADERTKELLKLAWSQGCFMAEVIPHLWIGDRASASQDLVKLRERGICAVVNCTVELPNYHEAAEGMSYLRVPVADAECADISAYFDSACAFVGTVLDSTDSAVLVHCHAGRSRSATIVLVCLMRRLGISLSEAMATCMAKRWVTPNPGFQALLAREEHRLSVGTK
mmetsp:Transcript_2341/g.4640  ORF Transcript_2341/g.4640 Transcript_2341/m.4640 type:complete len:246 (-) Transcript_2341:258-995(-)